MGRSLVNSGPKPRVRVLRVISRMNIGGPAIHVVLLNAGLDANRYDSLLVAGTEGAAEGTLRDLATARQLRLAIIPELGREIDPLRDIVTLYKLYRLIRRERPHIVHTHLAKAGFIGRVAARLAGVPVIVHTYHGHVFHGYFSPSRTRLFLRMERCCARISTRIVTISARLREEIAQYGVVEKEKVAVIPLGFDLTPFQEAARARRHGTFRAALGLTLEHQVIAVVGRLVKIKNLALFLDAAARAHARLPQLRFVIIGDGELRQDLETQVARQGLDAVTTFTGWRRDLPDIYADLDAVVISSDNEGTPVSLIEAMATGCPVIATSVGGVPDLIGDGQTGRLVPPGDADALARAICDLVQQPEATNTMAQRAQAFVVQRYQAERLIADIDGLYRSLLATRRIPVGERTG